MSSIKIGSCADDSSVHQIDKLYSLISKQASTIEQLSATIAELGSDTTEAAVATLSQTSRGLLLQFLQNLRASYSLEEFSNIIRIGRLAVGQLAVVSDGSIAVRVNELLVKLKSAGYGTPTRPDFMELLLQIGPGVDRRRSVRFGQTSQHAAVIPRELFSDEELRKIDTLNTQNPILDLQELNLEAEHIVMKFV